MGKLEGGLVSVYMLIGLVTCVSVSIYVFIFLFQFVFPCF